MKEVDFLAGTDHQVDEAIAIPIDGARAGQPALGEGSDLGEGSLTQDRFLPRLEAYLDLASTLRDRVENIDYVDVRFEDRIYVRPAWAPAALRRGKAASTTGTPKAAAHGRKK